MNPNKTELILGPPGTGKTTTLLEEVEKLLADDYDPTTIAFVSFTRKAANEAADRARVKFGFDRAELPFFRTLHSLAFRQLNLRSQDVMGLRDYLDLAKALKLHITFRGVQEDGTVVGLSKGDRMFFSCNLARVLGRDLKEWYMSEGYQEDIPYYELERVDKTIQRYKEKYGKIDFNDMMKRFVDEKPVPNLEVLFVDEAQDLAPLQWEMVEVLANSVTKTFVAGDDDQAIFQWAGADVERFIGLEGTSRVLEQSYRVPSRISKGAVSLLTHVRNRRHKEWLPRAAEGKLTYTNSVDQLSMDSETWYLLGRNTYLLGEYQDYCVRKGYLFESSIGAPVSSGVLASIRLWERLRRRESIPASGAKQVYKLLGTRVGVKYGFKKKLDDLDDDEEIDIDELRANFGLMVDKIWHKAFDKMKAEEREYLLSALRRGEKVSQEPRIRISTIHGVKGGQADNVVLFTDMAARTYREFLEKPDDEFRVWYVAATRAKERLIIINPRTNQFFNFRHYAMNPRQTEVIQDQSQ